MQKRFCEWGFEQMELEECVMESNGKNEAMGSNELVCANEYPDTVDGRSVSIYVRC